MAKIPPPPQTQPVVELGRNGQQRVGLLTLPWNLWLQAFIKIVQGLLDGAFLRRWDSAMPLPHDHATGPAVDLIDQQSAGGASTLLARADHAHRESIKAERDGYDLDSVNVINVYGPGLDVTIEPNIPGTSQDSVYAAYLMDEASGTRVKSFGSGIGADLAESGGTVPAGTRRGSITSYWTSPDTTPCLRVNPTPSAAIASGLTMACLFNMRSDGLPANARMNMFSIFGDTTVPYPQNVLLYVYRYCVGTDVDFIGCGQVKNGSSPEIGIAPATVGRFGMTQWHMMFSWWNPSDLKLHVQIDNGTDHSVVNYDFSALSIEQLRFGGAWGSLLAWHGSLARPVIWERVLTTNERTEMFRLFMSSVRANISANPYFAQTYGG